MPESAEGRRPSSAPSAPRPTPISAVPGVELDALDRAAESIQPSWQGAALPAQLPAPAAVPTLDAAAAPPTAQAPAPESSSNAGAAESTPESSSSAAAAEASAETAATHASAAESTASSAISGVLPALGLEAPLGMEAPLANPVATAALYYGSDPTPRGADSTQPMPPILLPTPWAQLTSHPLVERLASWRAQYPRLSLGVGGLLALVLVLALWPSSSPRLAPPPLPPAPLARTQAPAAPALPSAVAEEAPAPTPAPSTKAARKTTAKRREVVRAVPAKAAVVPAKAAVVPAKVPAKKAPEAIKPSKPRASISPNPYH